MPSNSFTNVYSADLLSRRFTGGELQKVNRLPTQTTSYSTLPPWNGGIAGRPAGRVNIQAVPFTGDTGESIFRVRLGESRKNMLSVDVEVRTHDPKTPLSVDNAFC